MLRCVIVDDEIGAINVLTNYITKVHELELVNSFQDSLGALDYLNNNSVDILFLDINMPDINGMQLSDLVREKQISIIFCTAYSEYAAASYEREAVDYLLKPISFDRFLKAVSKAVTKVNTDAAAESVRHGRPSRIFLKDGKKIHKVNLQEITYMRKDGHYIDIYTTKGKVASRMNMEELLKTLPQVNFVRIHRSYVIAIDKIEIIEKYFVTVGGQRIPIGDSFREEFFKRIHFTGN
jgi:DNA-binding LytR/AlgR family response regulator